MALADVIKTEPGKAFMMCNEAVVRGAIESDVKVVSFYPGAPTSERLDTFNSVQGHFDYKFTTATNERWPLKRLPVHQ